MRPKGSILILGLLVAFALLWLLQGRNDAPPSVHPFLLGDPLARPCSERSTTSAFKLDLALGAGERDVLSRFGVQRGWGAKENMSITQGPDGEGGALKVAYASGVSSPSTQSEPIAGASFYAPAGLGRGVTSACLRYSVFFPQDFDFVRGGKLPGLFGGQKPPSGGARPTGDDGFTLRVMWRKHGVGELYAYFPNMVPDSKRGGDQIGTGSWTFERGVWTQIEMEAELNDPGERNGVVRIWINGEPKLFVKDIEFRKSAALGIDGFMFSTFFGGQSARFAPPTDQVTYFKDIETFR